MNLSTYQNLIESVGLSKLDEANKDTYNIVKEGSANFTDPDLWKEMLVDADIKEAYELHVKALEKLAKEEPKAEMKVEKKETKMAKKPKSKRESKSPQLSVERKRGNKVAAVSSKKTKKKVKKVVAKAAKKMATKKEEVKFPVTVKKLSKELQLIKRMASMDGKRKTVNAITSLHRELGKVLQSNPDRKTVLHDMHTRLTTALEKAGNAGVKELDIKLEKNFKQLLIENVKHPRPKMKVEYLSGVDEGEKKK